MKKIVNLIYLVKSYFKIVVNNQSYNHYHYEIVGFKRKKDRDTYSKRVQEVYDDLILKNYLSKKKEIIK